MTVASHFGPTFALARTRRLLQLEWLEDRCVPATLTITTIADNDVNDSVLSLREAIEAVNDGAFTGNQQLNTLAAGTVDLSNPFGTNDTILFDNGTLVSDLSGQTITIDTGGGYSDFIIATDVMIDGSALSSQIKIDGNDASRVFVLDRGGVGLNATLDSVTIQNGRVAGLGAGLLLANAADTLSIFNSTITGNHAHKGGGIASYGTLNITGSTITGNHADGPNSNYLGGGSYIGGGIAYLSDSTISNNYAYSGGGIYSVNASVEMHNVVISKNVASHIGGGMVANSNSVTDIYDSLITGNTSDSTAGGLYNRSSSVMRIIRSVVSDNTSYNSYAGGVYDGGDLLLVVDSTITHNYGQEGAGLASEGSLVIVMNSTLSDNHATDQGGAISIFGPDFYLINSTVSGNTAPNSGGGVLLGSSTNYIINSTITGNTAGTNGGGIIASSTTYLNNSIVAGNTATGLGNDLFDSSGTNVSGSNNIFTTGGVANNTSFDLNSDFVADVSSVINTTLADNGGPTQTHALTSNSVAINAGDNALAVDENGDPLTFDQRGVLRPIGLVDIGAYETGAAFSSGAAGATVTTSFQVTINAINVSGLLGSMVDSVEKSIAITNGIASNFVNNGDGTTTFTVTPSDVGDVIIDGYNASLTITAVSSFSSTIGSATYAASFVTITGETVTLNDIEVTGGVARQLIDNGDGTFTFIFAPNGVGEITSEFTPLSFGSTDNDFIRNLYTVIYTRTPLDNEVAFWTTQLSNGATRTDVLRGFLASDEFTGKFVDNAALVDGLYQVLFGRNAETTFWTDLLNQGSTLDEVLTGILASEEYYIRVVQETYNEFLLRPSDESGQTFWVDELLAGDLNIDELRAMFAASDESLEL